MEQSWKKRYSFRLKKGDQELHDLLEGLPDSKRSEAIRQMLLFACRSMTEEKQSKLDIERVHNQMQELQALVAKQHQELMNSMSQASAHQIESPTVAEEKKQITEKALTDSAAAMLSSFSIQ